MYKILIVEDDAAIARLLKDNLLQWNLTAEMVTDFHDVITKFKEYIPDLVVLDISLLFFNGYYWCNEIRKISEVPIVFLSSHTENMDIVMAMNMGGDDFIVKPFSMDILVAKVQALLRRTYAFQGESNTLEAKGALLNINTTNFSYGDGEVILTKNEFRILYMLMERKNHVVTREDLMKALWDSDSFVDDNALTVNVNRLRKHLSALGLDDFIETKKGIGYIVND